LDPQIGTETGKTSPVLVVQTNLLNKRLIKKVGNLPHELTGLIKENIQIIIDLE
jgi:mRNA-degrading endonuclease toxin of MazEF toxin-antitoxin module